MNVLVFLSIRALHVAVAATWIGSTLFQSMLLMPAVEDAGAAGGRVMDSVHRRGLHIYMMSLGISTVVTGLYLLWRFTGGFDRAVIVTHAGIAFATGGAAGVTAGLIGGGVVGRSAAAVIRVMAAAAGLEDGADKRALISQAVTLKQRIKVGTRFALAMQGTALVLMAVGHYV
jgi:hypothetical protein